MTHTLHRRGTEESLEQDFVVLAMGARGVNRDGCAPKIRQILEIMSRHNPVNYGDVFTGNSITSHVAEMASNIRENTVAHAVFRSEDDLVRFLNEIRETDIGLSIVVSGLFEHVHECCKKAHLEPHTVNTSLGIHGRTDKLPEEPILEIATMCGHAMISYNLIRRAASDIRAGTVTARDAARKLAANCHCGIFNWERAERILSAMAAK